MNTAHGMKHYSEFTCHTCGHLVRLHGYPDGTYDYFGKWTHHSAHNPSDVGTLDGFSPNPIYVCRDCEMKIDCFMASLRKENGLGMDEKK